MPVTAAQLSGFLDWLRDGGSGFEASDQQFFAAQRLMETLADRGEWPAGKDSWRMLLAPVLCSSPSQQQRFYDLLDQWFVTPQEFQKPPGGDDETVGGARKQPIPRAAWVYGVLCVIVASALTAGVLFYWSHRPHRPATLPPPATRLPVNDEGRKASVIVHTADGKPVPDATARYAGKSAQTDSSGTATLDLQGAPSPRFVVVTKPEFRSEVLDFPAGTSTVTLRPPDPIPRPRQSDARFVRWFVRHPLAFLFVVMVIPGVLLLLWLIRMWRKALELRRWASTSEQRMRRIGMSNRGEPLFQAGDIRRLAVALRRRRPEESPELDLQSTVETTCREAGYFTPVYARRNSEPEYLFLGERKNLRDHQSRMQDELIQRLHDHDVYVQRYYFQSSPSTCSDARGDVFSLPELAAMHPDHEVWLALDSLRCLDPVSGAPERWWGQLTHWRYRALLSFSKAEVDTELRITDPTRDGIESLVRETAQPTGEDREHPYPSLLEGTPEGWLSRLEPPPAAIARLNAQLQVYLGAHGYLLLQACAVYPDIAWNITDSLAGALVPADEREAALNRLAALPWFRHGIMPDWLRVRLVSRLGANEEPVRAALRRFLDSTATAARQREEALEIVPGAPRRKRSSKGALRDNVYLAFASGSRLDQLSVIAPKGWRKFLRDSVWRRVGAAVLAMAALWFVTTRTMNRVANRPLSGAPVHFRPVASDPFVTALLQSAEGIEAKPGKSDPVVLLKSAYEAASDVLGVNNPVVSVSRVADLDGLARKLGTGAALQPGMVVQTSRGLELVKAIERDYVITFGSKDWYPVQDLNATWDLNGIQLQAVPARSQYEADSPIAPPLSGTKPSTSTAAEDPDVVADRKACNGGKADACESVGLSYDVGEGLPKDYVRAVAYYRKACDGGSAEGCTFLGTMYEFGEGVSEDDKRAAALFRKGCDGGYSEGCKFLGDAYENGWGVPKDSANAVPLYRKVCDGKDWRGCSVLASMYERGEGVPKDYAQAVALYRKGCDGGDYSECVHLGNLYENGTGVIKDNSQAIALYREACDGGDKQGCTELKRISGQTASAPTPPASNPSLQPPSKASTEQLASNTGDAAAADADARGRALYNAKRYSDAIPLYTTACDAGNANGCADLGGMYLSGTGVAKDYAKALGLSIKGCDRGDSHGCSDVGFMYEHGGSGISVNYQLARIYYDKGCRADPKDQVSCDALVRLGPAKTATPDPDLAPRLTQGCDRGSADDCNTLGTMYEAGTGVLQDSGKAFTLFTKACNAGSAAGCSDLGNLYRIGHGVAADPTRARQFFQKGCSMGNTWGCDQLKEMK